MMVELQKSDLRVKVFSGKAVFTVKNEETGNRFTFKVVKLSEKRNYNTNPLWFVSVLVGPLNTHHYKYIGTCFDTQSFTYGKKSKIVEDSQSIKVWKWFLSHLNKLPDNVKVFHEGQCLKCGKVLTVPESIESGLGPICSQLIYGK